jgi:hypothetical protein
MKRTINSVAPWVEALAVEQEPRCRIEQHNAERRWMSGQLAQASDDTTDWMAAHGAENAASQNKFR